MRTNLTNGKTKRNYKDSIFRSLFNDEKELLSLYNALSGKNYPEDTEIEIVTLDNAIFNDQKNDLAFVVNKTFINLTEQQSTLSPNMLLRFLEYIAEEYKKLYFSKTIYSMTPVVIPTPEFYVLYNGVKEAPLEQTLKLSDTFAGEYDTISLELIVHVINVNYEKGAKILERCQTLKEYSLFIHKVRTLLSEYDDLDIAIRESISECIDAGILSDFLKGNRGDVMSFLHLQLSQEEREKIRENDGYIRGKEEGIKEGITETARKMKTSGMPVEQIIEFTGLTEEEIEKL